MVSFLLKCFQDGTFEINGKRGDEISLPDCAQIGCDPSELDEFNSKEYEKSDGCHIGYVEVNGKKLEKNRNMCFRRCGENFEFKSKKKIKCVCDYSTRHCEYQVIPGKAVGWVYWKTLRPNGTPYIPTDQCPPTESPTEPPTVQPATWGEWGHWGACSATCGDGVQLKNRECLCGGYPDSRVLNNLLQARIKFFITQV